MTEPTLFAVEESMVYRDAIISECGLYRYHLERWWEHAETENIVCFIMLNPSIADAEQDDPTIRRCVDFARRWGHDCMAVLNLFAFRATDPKTLRAAADPVGPDNDDHLSMALCGYDRVVAAWGTNGRWRERDLEVMKLLNGARMECLGMNKNGTPKHPLFVPANTALRPYTGCGR